MKRFIERVKRWFRSQAQVAAEPTMEHKKDTELWKWCVEQAIRAKPGGFRHGGDLVDYAMDILLRISADGVSYTGKRYRWEKVPSNRPTEK